MIKIKKACSRIITFALTGIMVVSLCGASITVKASSDNTDSMTGQLRPTVKIDENNFPDENFRYYLKYKDLDKDGVLTGSEMDSVKQLNLYITTKKVKSLKGIEHFTELEELDCDNNQLTELDISKNTKLKVLVCGQNNIASLDISNNLLLEELCCDNNKLTSLDVSKHTNLKKLELQNNQISEIDISKSVNLENLNCGNNLLSQLNVENHTKLKTLDFRNNAIDNIDIGNLIDLENLSFTNIDDFDISKNTKLKRIYVGGEKVKEIDVSKNTKLTQFSCYESSVDSIDLSKNIALERIFVVENMKLEELDLSNNVNAVLVKCYDNYDLKKLDLGNNQKLGYLDISCCDITELDLSKQINLQTLFCQGGILKSINISNCTILKEVYLDNNQLTSLDVSNLGELTRLQCTSNQLTSLKLQNNDSLTTILCSGNQLSTLDASGAKNLESFGCTNNNLTDLNVTGNSKLRSLRCYENQLTNLDVSNNANLEILKCSNNFLKGIDVSNCPKLKDLDITLNWIEAVKPNNNSELVIKGMDEQIRDVLTNNDGSISNVLGTAKIIHKSLETITLDNTQLTVTQGEELRLTANVAPADADLTTVHWTSSNESVAAVDENGVVTAKAYGTATITATAADMSGVTASCTVTVATSEANDDTSNTKTYPTVNVSYRTHIQTFGWEGKAEDITTWKTNGNMSGTSGKAKRLEGINIVVDSADSNKDLDLGIQYTTHCQSYGWLPWSADGDMNGTEGEAKRLEAIMIQLTGEDAKGYDVYYRVHAQSYGWLGWASNGAPAGTAGFGKRLEGIQIVVVKKGESFNQKIGDIASAKTEAFVANEGESPIVNYPSTSNTNPVVPGADTPNVAYRTHVQSYGWQGWKYNGQMSGTSGKAKRLEGININLTNKDYDGGIAYTTHVQTYGWQGDENDSAKWMTNGAMSGTSGEAKRLEAIKIELTGEMANHYDIYYRVHAQSYGWLGWAKNGEPSGTAGYAKRLEGIQIVLIPKGGTAPGDYQGIKSVNEKPYIEN